MIHYKIRSFSIAIIAYQTNLLLRHGEAEVCNDGLKLDSHCRLDLGPREHLRGIERLKKNQYVIEAPDQDWRMKDNSAVYRVACLRHEDQVLLQHLRVNYIFHAILVKNNSSSWSIEPREDCLEAPSQRSWAPSRHVPDSPCWAKPLLLLVLSRPLWSIPLNFYAEP